MEAVFLILTAGLAGYLAYAYLFARKGPVQHHTSAADSSQNEIVSFGEKTENSATLKRDEQKEIEEISHKILTGESDNAISSILSIPSNIGAVTSVQSIFNAFYGWFFKTFLAEARRARMQAQCLREFPEMLDILTLGLKAGLSFDGSLELYTSRYTSMLALLLSQGMIVWKLGLSSRVDVLDALSSHLKIGAFTRFFMAVTESLEFGIPLADSLSRQATEIRREQRLQVEEGIEKIPVKMLIPMGVFVVPAMLLAILGPLLSSALKMG